MRELERKNIACFGSAIATCHFACLSIHGYFRVTQSRNYFAELLAFRDIARTLHAPAEPRRQETALVALTMHLKRKNSIHFR